MTVSGEELDDFIDGLCDRSDDIEDSVKKFFEGVERRANGRDALGNQNYNWITPQGEVKEAQREARSEYEIWYTSARPLIDEYLPGRLDNFDTSYNKFQKCISLEVDASYGYIRALDEAIDAFDRQRSLVKSIPAKLKGEQLRARKQISGKLTRDEIQQARQLFNNDFIRASGVVAAVALERHLLTMCDNADEVDNYDPTHGISRLGQTLKDSEVIDKTVWNDLRALASIRETCAHAEEPRKEAVRRLINDTEEIIRKLD